MNSFIVKSIIANNFLKSFTCHPKTWVISQDKKQRFNNNYNSPNATDKTKQSFNLKNMNDQITNIAPELPPTLSATRQWQKW